MTIQNRFRTATVLIALGLVSLVGCSKDNPLNSPESSETVAINVTSDSGNHTGANLSVAVGESYALDCNPEGFDTAALTYKWTCDLGSFDRTNTSHAKWTAPATPGTATIVVTVSGIGSAAADTIRIGVFDPRLRLLAPASGAILDNGCLSRQDEIDWEFSWAFKKQAEKYHLYVIGGQATYPVIDNSNITEKSYRHISPSSYITEPNRYNWKWKVRALVDGAWTDWTKERIFDVEPLDTDCAVQQGKVLVDASHGGGGWWFPQSSQTGFDPDQPHQGKALADYIRGLGFQVDELPRGITITDSLLSSYDRVIRAGKFFSYTASELQAYDNFVNRQTSLILISEYMRPGATDALAEQLGLQFVGIAKGYVNRYAPHPITEGATPFYYNAGSVILDTVLNPSIEFLGWLDDSTYVDLNNNGSQDSDEPTGMPVMGVLHHPTCKIFFIGEINGFEGVPQPLIGNLIEWSFL